MPPARTRGARPMSALDAIAQRGFVALWLSTGINHSGQFLRGTIQSWLVLQLTNSSAWVGVVNGFPVIVSAPLSFLAGALADRSDPRRILMWTRAATSFFCFVTAYAITAGFVNVYLLVVLATILNASYYLSFPSNQTFIVALVGPERLLAANSLINGVGFGLNFILPRRPVTWPPSSGSIRSTTRWESAMWWRWWRSISRRQIRPLNGRRGEI